MYEKMHFVDYEQGRELLITHVVLEHLLSLLFLLLFSCSVMSNLGGQHGLQHTMRPCPSLPPRVCSNSHPLSQWYHPTISSSASPFFCFQSFPASESFPMSQLFTAGRQSVTASASASVLPMHIQGWFPLGLTGWISLLSKGLSRVFSNITIQKHQLFCAQPLYGPTLASIYDYWKKHSFDYTDLSWHLQNDFTCLRLRLAK